jgi:predicted DNA-binding transcriptional regulator AlpA
MTIDELAPLLKRDVETLRRDLSRRPESLPPRLLIPGTRRLVWLEQDVKEWLRRCRQ